MTAWCERRLKKLVKIKHGFAFKGEHFSDQGDYLLLTPGNIYPKGGLKLKGDKETFYTGEIPRGYILAKDDLVVVMTDLTQDAAILGGAMLIDKSDFYLHNQRLGLVSHSAETNRRYLSHFFNWQFFRDQVKASSNGATVKHTSPARIYNCRIFLPPVPVQRNIAAILSTYDDLIQNCRQRISLLERVALECYREWFTRFRFPGHESAIFIKGIPEKWKIKRFDEIANFTMGQSPPSQTYNEVGDGPPFHQGVGTFGARFPLTAIYCNGRGRKARKGDILFSVRAPVGRLNVADCEMIIGRGLAAMRHKEGHNSYLFYLLKAVFATEDIIGNGSIFNAVGKGELAKFPILQPNDDLIANFQDSVSKVDQQIEVLSRSIENLTKSRDMLLPRLMSGTLSIESLNIEFPPSMTSELDAESISTTYA